MKGFVFSIMDDVPLRILLLVLLTFLNAFFASAEIALIQINETKFKKMAESGDKKAGKVLKLVGNTGKLLSNIQVGVTLSGFLSSAFACRFVCRFDCSCGFEAFS